MFGIQPTEERASESSDSVSSELSDESEWEDIGSEDSGDEEVETVEEGDRQDSDEELDKTIIYGQDEDCPPGFLSAFVVFLSLLK